MLSRFPQIFQPKRVSTRRETQKHISLKETILIGHYYSLLSIMINFQASGIRRVRWRVFEKFQTFDIVARR